MSHALKMNGGADVMGNMSTKQTIQTENVSELRVLLLYELL